MQRLTLIKEPPGSIGISTPRRDTTFGVNQIPLAVIGSEQSHKPIFISNFIGRLETEGEMKRILDLEKASYELRILTTVGFEGYFFVYEESWLNAQGFIFLYNVCNRESFNYFGVFKERLFRLKQTERMPMLLVGFLPEGNEDMREVSTEEGQKVAERGGFLFQEIIGVNKAKIDEAFGTILQEILNFYAGRTTGQTVGASPSWAFDAASGEIIEFERIPECRVLVAGDCFVGKTSMIQLLTSATQSSLKYISTSALEVAKHEFQYDKDCISVTVIDSPGWWEPNDFASTKEEIMFVQGILLVFSVLSRDSFSRVEQLAKTLLSIVGKTKLPMVLVGNKAEGGLEYRNVSCEEGVGLAKRLECKYFETSLTKRDSIQQAFANLAKGINTHMAASSEVFKLCEEDVQRAGTLQVGDKTGKKWTSQPCEVDVGAFMSEGGKLTVSLHSATVEIDDSLNGPGRFAFVVTVHDKKFILAANTDEERKFWVTSLKVNAAIAEMASSIIEETMHKMLAEHLPKGLRQSDSPRSEYDEDMGASLSTSLSFSGLPSVKESSSSSLSASSTSLRKKKGLFNSLRRGSLSHDVGSSTSSSSSSFSSSSSGPSPRSSSSKKDDKKSKKG